MWGRVRDEIDRHEYGSCREETQTTTRQARAMLIREFGVFGVGSGLSLSRCDLLGGDGGVRTVTIVRRVACRGAQSKV